MPRTFILAHQINESARRLRAAGVRLSCNHGEGHLSFDRDDGERISLSRPLARELMASARALWGAAGTVSYENALLHVSSPVLRRTMAH